MSFMVIPLRDNGKFSILRLILALAVVAISLFIADRSPVYALCAKDPSTAPVAEMFSNATSVFSGRVVNTQPYYRDGIETLNVKYIFEVSRLWKGRSSKYLTVVGGIEVVFDKRLEYMIYAIGTQEELYVGSCNSRSLPIQFTSEDLKVLGPGEEPPSLIETYMPYIILGFGLFGISILGNLCFLIKRFRRN
jgi:hypothetical protein